MSDEKYKRAVVFVDSLGNDDLAHMPWTREHMQTGEMDAGPVFVTPVVLGSIYTGQTPTDHGLPSISRYGQAPRLRPRGTTIPELAAAADVYENVIQLGLPFIVPPTVEPDGNYWHISEAMGNQAVMPEQAEPALTIPSPGGRLDLPDENLDLAYNLRIDHCMATFGLARNLMEKWDAGLTFISLRTADSYCHYHYSEPDGGQTYRQGLLEQIDDELRYLSNQAEVLVFGDHGARELTEVFRLNRWLIEHDYLSVDIDEYWRQQATEYGVLSANEDQPGEVLTADSPGVTVDEEASVAINDDPFSSGITLLGGADETSVADLIAELSDEDAVEEVAWTRELFGDGALQDECPDLYATRAPGAFVSGNLHPELGGAELTRSGVHHPIGAYGATDGVSPAADRIGPQELFDVIAEEFLGLPTDVEAASGADGPTGDKRDVRQHLQDLGYI